MLINNLKEFKKNLIIDNPDVVKVDMMGQNSLQITGEIREGSEIVSFVG